MDIGWQSIIFITMGVHVYVCMHTCTHTYVCAVYIFACFCLCACGSYVHTRGGGMGGLIGIQIREELIKKTISPFPCVDQAQTARAIRPRRESRLEQFNGLISRAGKARPEELCPLFSVTLQGKTLV